MTTTKLLVAYFDDEDAILRGAKEARRAGLEVQDAWTPYPVHGMDAALGIPTSRLGKVCFAFGSLGLATALLFQWWSSAVDWPLNVGGKPHNSFPAFIPVAFELTVLFAALGTVLALLVRTRLFPRVAPRFLLPRVTDDRFALGITAASEESKAREILERAGAVEVTWVEAAR